MAGFAINVQLLFKYPQATMPYKAGFEEDRFLSGLDIQLDEIEPKADNCTRVRDNTSIIKIYIAMIQFSVLGSNITKNNALL